ncbi:MAG: hypothetical protein ACTHKR_02135, partial [Sphingomonas sp.]
MIVPPDAIGEVVGDVCPSGKLMVLHEAFAAVGRSIIAASSPSHIDRIRQRWDPNVAKAVPVNSRITASACGQVASTRRESSALV